MQTIATQHDPNCNKWFSNYICNDCFNAWLKAQNMTHTDFINELQIEAALLSRRMDKRRKNGIFGMLASTAVFWASLYSRFYLHEWGGVIVLLLIGSFIWGIHSFVTFLNNPKTSSEEITTDWAKNKYVIAAYRQN